MYVIIEIFLLPNDSHLASQRGASDSFAYVLLLSNSADVYIASCLGLCGRDICPKSYA